MYEFDGAGRLTELEHRNGTSDSGPLAKYNLQWDIADRIEEIDSLLDGLVDYGYDEAGQLTSATYQFYGPFQMDEGYYYDDNGNRISAEFVDGNPIELTGYWEMDAGGSATTAVDSSGNGLTLSFAGSPAWTSSGTAPIPGNAYSLSFPNKGDYLTLSSASTLQPGSSDYSASTWIKSSSSITQDIPIMGFGTPNGNNGKGFELVYRAGVSGKPLVLRVNDGSGNAQSLSYSTVGSLADGNWHHVGFSIDRDGQTILYIDGRAVKAATSSQTNSIQPTGAFQVGRAPGISMTSGALARWMDETRVYHHAVSPAEMWNQFQGVDNGSSATYERGTNNQLLDDEGRYSFSYDDEGNRSARTHIVGMGGDSYSWDHRNRLTKVERSGTREAFWLNFESDDGAAIVDNLGNAVDGAMVNNAEMDYADPHGGDSGAHSLHLDGNEDFGDMGIQDTFRPGVHGLTLMAWMYPETKSGAMGIVAFGGTASSEPGYSLTYERTAGGNNKFVFSLSDGVGSTTDSFTYSVSGTSLVNAWHHVAVTVDAGASQIKLYLDGSSIQTWTLTETMAWGNVLQPFLIGVSSVSAADYFKGQLDEIRVAPMAVDASYVDWVQDEPEPELVNTMTVDYAYDHQNRLISREVDIDGDAGPEDPVKEYFVHDGAGQSVTSATPDPDNLDEVGQIVLRLDDTGAVTHRYLWGPGVDQLLADEAISTPGSSGETRWALGDQLGSVRDVVTYDSGTDTVESLAHRTYDSFGNLTSEQNENAVDILFGYTGRQFDDATGLQNNLNRWYDPAVGRWISEDPIRFGGGDANLARYAGNSPLSARDASGLLTMGIGGGFSLHWGCVNFNISFDFHIVLDTSVPYPNLEVGFTGSAGGGAAVSLGGGFDGHLSLTDANSLEELSGSGGYGGAHATAGGGGFIQQVWGYDGSADYPQETYHGYEVGFEAGYGGGIYGGQTTTVSIPIYQSPTPNFFKDK